MDHMYIGVRIPQIVRYLYILYRKYLLLFKTLVMTTFKRWLISEIDYDNSKVKKKKKYTHNKEIIKREWGFNTKTHYKFYPKW